MNMKERGFALIMTAVILSVVGIIAAVLITVSITTVRLSGNIASHKQALYAAESGIEYARYLIHEKEDEELVNMSIDLSDNLAFMLDFSSGGSEDEHIKVKITGIEKELGSTNIIEVSFAKLNFGGMENVVLAQKNISLTGEGDIEEGRLMAGNIKDKGTAVKIGGDFMLGSANEVKIGAKRGAFNIAAGGNYRLVEHARFFMPDFDWDKVREDGTSKFCSPDEIINGQYRVVKMEGNSQNLYFLEEDLVLDENEHLSGRGILFIDGALHVSGGKIGEISEKIIVIVKDDVYIDGESEYYSFIVSEGDICAKADSFGEGGFISTQGEINIEGDIFLSSGIYFGPDLSNSEMEAELLNEYIHDIYVLNSYKEKK